MNYEICGLIAGLLLFALSLNSCASAKSNRLVAKNQEWQIAKVDAPNWTIYTRKISGTNFLEYKIEGQVAASPMDCLTSFRDDLHEQANNPKNKKYPTYDIVQESRDSLLTYVVHKEPFPFKNTEMSVRYRFYHYEDGSYGVNWKEAWEESPVQPSKKLKRVESFRGSWEFAPIANGSCQAVNTVQFDPKKMPMWLVRPMVFKFLKNGLKDIREETQKRSLNKGHKKENMAVTLE